MWGRVVDVIICVKFYRNRLRGFRVVGGRKWGSSIDFDSRPYNRSALPCCLWYMTVWLQPMVHSKVRAFTVYLQACILHLPTNWLFSEPPTDYRPTSNARNAEKWGVHSLLLPDFLSRLCSVNLPQKSVQCWTRPVLVRKFLGQLSGTVSLTLP